MDETYAAGYNNYYKWERLDAFIEQKWENGIGSVAGSMQTF